MQHAEHEYVQRLRELLMVKFPQSYRTHDTYCSCLSRFLKEFRHNVQRATSAQITAYLSGIDSRATMAQMHTVLNHFYSLILKQPDKVDKYIPYPKREFRLPHLPNKQQVMEMIEGIANLKHQLMVRLLYAAGLRLDELIHLRWSDIRRESSDNPLSIHVRGKGRKDRIVPLSKQTFAALTDYCNRYKLNGKTNKDHYIFGDAHPYSAKSVQMVVKRAGESIDIKLSPHKLRHCFGQHHYDNGMPLEKIQMLMGHNTIETTRIYARLTPQREEMLL